MIRSAILVAAALSLAGAAAAAEPSAKPSEGQYVDLSPVGLPIVVKGRLVNYVFVTVRLDLAPGANVEAWREKEPYFRDALVRVAHRTPFTRPDDYTKLNEPALRAAMTAEAARIAGPRTVSRIEFLNQSPQRVTGLPKPGAP